MIEETFWIYGIPAIAFLFGFGVGIAFMMVRSLKCENDEMDRELKKAKQKDCDHRNSRYAEEHPNFPWTCNRCDMNHTGYGVNQE